jgi:hypothetical protein
MAKVRAGFRAVRLMKRPTTSPVKPKPLADYDAIKKLPILPSRGSQPLCIGILTSVVMY